MEKPEIGHVTGQVANQINNHAAVTFVANYSPPPPPPSPTVQMLRDKMPHATHDALDWLMQHAHFSAAELYWACKQQGLVAPDGVLRQSRIARVDYAWSLAFSFMAGLMLLACMLLLAAGPALEQGLTIIGTAVVMGVCMCAALAVGVWPHETARKAVKALQGRQN
jgi:hypothetical protein